MDVEAVINPGCRRCLLNYGVGQIAGEILCLECATEVYAIERMENIARYDRARENHEQ